jgi:hypothetical protein
MDRPAISAFARVLAEIHLHVQVGTGASNYLLYAMDDAYGGEPCISWVYIKYSIEKSKMVIQSWYDQIERPKIHPWSLALLAVDKTNGADGVGGVDRVDRVWHNKFAQSMWSWIHHRIVEGLVADASLRAKLLMLIRHRDQTEGSSMKNLPLDICKEILRHANQHSYEAL